MGICAKCGQVMPSVNQFCPMCETQEVPMLKLYTPRLKAYEMPELFEPVNLDLSDDDTDDIKLPSFNLPVAIEAVMGGLDSDTIFLVKEKNGVPYFQPRKIDAMLFHTAKEANEYIQKVLKPTHSDRWSFVIWSYNALIK